MIYPGPSREFSRMILLVHGFTFAVGLAVLILLIVAITAIWERLRDDRKRKKFEEKRP
jgi:hypothetical protein